MDVDDIENECVLHQHSEYKQKASNEIPVYRFDVGYLAEQQTQQC